MVVLKPNAISLSPEQELSQSEEEELLSWESFMKDNYLASLWQVERQSMEHRIQDTAEK